MIQLFRVRGIPVRVDAGWLLIFGLVSWNLASGYFPHVLPETLVGVVSDRDLRSALAAADARAGIRRRAA